MNTLTRNTSSNTLHSNTYPASHTSYLKHGITRTQLGKLLTSLFSFPSDYLDTLDNYYLLHWTGQYTTGKISDGKIRHQDTDYSVIYQFCTPSSVRSAKQVKLSFRTPKKEFALLPYVIVRIKED